MCLGRSDGAIWVVVVCRAERVPPHCGMTPESY